MPVESKSPMSARETAITDLAECASLCFKLARAPRLSHNLQDRLNSRGQSLREQLVDMARIYFDETIEDIADVTASIKTTRKALESEAKEIKNIAKTLETVNSLLGMLDKFLGKLIPG